MAMRKTDVIALFDYMYWANHRILDAAAQLPADKFAAPSSLTTRDLRATLVHELDVEWSWRLRLQGRSNEDEADLEPDDYPDVAAISEHWRRDEAEMREWLDTLTDEQLEGSVGSDLTDQRRLLWHYLMHVLMHAAQQQADAATLLSLAGRSPGDLGFLEYLSSSA